MEKSVIAWVLGYLAASILLGLTVNAESPQAGNANSPVNPRSRTYAIEIHTALDQATSQCNVSCVSSGTIPMSNGVGTFQIIGATPEETARLMDQVEIQLFDGANSSTFKARPGHATQFQFGQSGRDLVEVEKEMRELMEQMEQLRRQQFPFGRSGRQGLILNTQVIGNIGSLKIDDKGDHYVATMKADGQLSNLNIEVDGRMLSVRGTEEKIEEQTDANGRVYSRSRSSRSIHSSVTLPGPVDAAKMDSKFENGQLIITLPKDPNGKRVQKGGGWL